jgi:hypothetical protein
VRPAGWRSGEPDPPAAAHQRPRHAIYRGQGGRKEILRLSAAGGCAGIAFAYSRKIAFLRKKFFPGASPRRPRNPVPTPQNPDEPATTGSLLGAIEADLRPSAERRNRPRNRVESAPECVESAPKT